MLPNLDLIDADPSRSAFPMRLADHGPQALSVFILLASLLSLVYLGYLEFMVFNDQPIHIDEIFFAVCAIRGLAVGEIPIAGCHDNKGPLIYLLYQLIERPDHLFSMLDIKTGAVAFVAVALILVGLIAYRMKGIVAALCAAAVAAQAMASDPEMLALKTEIVGTVFLLGGASFLLTGRNGPRLLAILASGLLFGLAIVTKQTFALTAVAASLWLVLLPIMPGEKNLRTRAFRVTAFGLAALLPFLAFWLVFSVRGQQSDFLASFFLHAAAYGRGGPALSWSERAWKVGWLSRAFASVYPLTLLFMAAAMQNLVGPERHPASDATGKWQLRLFLLLALSMGIVPIVSRQFFQHHLLPAWLLMSIPAGVFIGTLVSNRSQAGWFSTLGLVLLASSLMMSIDSWYLNGDRNKRQASRLHELDAASRIETARGSYGYVLGIRPEFYFYNGIVPASDILYPEALTDGYRDGKRALPDLNSFLGRQFALLRQQGGKRLLDDFSRTPPRYIFTVDRFALAASQAAPTDVPALNGYISQRCQLLRIIQGKPYQTGRLYSCSV